MTSLNVPAATSSRGHLVQHLRAYGYRHFDSADAYYEWFDRRLGKLAAKVEHLRAKCTERPSPVHDRAFMDFVAAPAIRGVVGSIQTDDIAQATWMIGVVLDGRCRILDVGCGTGEASTWLARIGGADRTVLGIDFSSKSVAAARAQATKLGIQNVTFEAGDFTRELPAGSFDAVVDMASLQYAGDPADALQRVRAVLADDGLFVAAPMLGRVREINEYLDCVVGAGLYVRRFEWVLARDLGRNVARPLIVAAPAGDPMPVDVTRHFEAVAAQLRTGRVVPIFDTH